MHFHRLGARFEAGDLGVEQHGAPLVGLDLKGQCVGGEIELSVLGEERAGRAFELDGDLRHASRQAFAGPQIERHARPPPVVDRDAERRICLRRRFRADAFLLPIARRWQPPRQTRGILPAGDVTPGVKGQRLDRAKEFHLFIADRLRVERDRRLHRGEREELHRMILDHVAQAAALFIIAGARAHAAVLRHGDLHAFDEIPVPQRLEDRVREPLDEEILHRLLPEVMVDAKNLSLLHHAGDDPVELARRGQIAAKRFLDHGLRLQGRTGVALCQSRRTQVFEDRPEHRGRSGDVKQRLQLPSGLRFELLNERVEPVERGAFVVAARHIKRVARHATPRAGIQLPPGEFLDRRLRMPAEFLVRDRLAAKTDQIEVGRQQVVIAQIVNRRQQFARGQVARSAKDDDDRRGRAAVLAQSLQKRMR